MSPRKPACSLVFREGLVRDETPARPEGERDLVDIGADPPEHGLRGQVANVRYGRLGSCRLDRGALKRLGGVPFYCFVRPTEHHSKQFLETNLRVRPNAQLVPDVQWRLHPCPQISTICSNHSSDPS